MRRASSVRNNQSHCRDRTKWFRTCRFLYLQALKVAVPCRADFSFCLAIRFPIIQTGGLSSPRSGSNSTRGGGEDYGDSANGSVPFEGRVGGDYYSGHEISR